MMRDVNEICDYIIFNLKAEDPALLSNIKLQKLLYYVQAWHLAFYNKALFKGKFQAWIHGPVHREIFDRFRDSKYLYSEINFEDIINPKINEKLSDSEKAHINSILETYSPYSGVQLEDMSHNEDPWIITRNGYSSSARCEEEIDNEFLGNYFKKRLG